MSDNGGSLPPPAPPLAGAAHVGARTYALAIGLLLATSFPALIVAMLLPDWPQPFHSLRFIAIFLACMAAGGWWQRLKGVRPWAIYVVLAIVAWFVTLLALLGAVVAAVSWFLDL